MPRIPFSELPDEARLWVFPLSRPLNAQEEGDLLDRVDAFLDDWAAHGRPLTAARDWLEGRFLLVGVDESTAPPSGCSIDSLVRILREMGASQGVDFLNHGPVWYRDEEGVHRVPRQEFKTLVTEGSVDRDTHVFDNTITRVSQLREGGWEKPASRSWHGKAFFGSGSRS